MATANTTVTEQVPELTVEHVMSSLAQIETWLGAVRLALAGLAPGTPLLLRELAVVTPSALRVRKDCPPPRPKKDKKKR